MKINNIFKITNLSYTYDEKQEPRIFQVEGINIEIRENFFSLICGPDGSGKTTLVNLLLGNLKFIHGSILCNGTELKNISKSAINKLQQSFVLVNGICFEEVDKTIKLHEYISTLLGNHHFKKEDIPTISQQLLNVTSLSTRKNITIEYLKASEKQKLSLIQGLISGKKVLIIEDLNKLISSKKYEDFMFLLRDYFKDRTVVITMNEADDNIIDYIDDVFYLENGHIETVESYSDVPRMLRDF